MTESPNAARRRSLGAAAFAMRPVILLGFTPDGRNVLGGSFQMADERGFPLADFLVACRERNCVHCVPHYVFSALAAGWDDDQIVAHLQEGYRDAGELPFDARAMYLRALEHALILCYDVNWKSPEFEADCDRRHVYVCQALGELARDRFVAASAVTQFVAAHDALVSLGEVP